MAETAYFFQRVTTPAQIAAQWGCSCSTVIACLRDGRVKGWRDAAGRWRAFREDVPDQRPARPRGRPACWRKRLAPSRQPAGSKDRTPRKRASAHGARRRERRTETLAGVPVGARIQSVCRDHRQEFIRTGR